MYMDNDYIKFVNRTYSKPFSQRQVLPKFVIAQSNNFINSKNMRVLDYGAGKDIYGTKILRDAKCFREVVAYDIGDNFVEGLHDKYVLNNKYKSDWYDIAMLSNVINVQPSISDIISVLEDVKSCMKPKAFIYCNLPDFPRKSEITESMLHVILRGVFGDAHWYGNNIIEAVNVDDWYGVT
jgi:hypothetical protein